MISYLLKHPEKIWRPFIDHIKLVFVVLIISLLIATVLTMLSVRFEKTGYFLIQVFSVVYSIPSLALFALLIPITGLGTKSAVPMALIDATREMYEHIQRGVYDVKFEDD